MTINIGLHGASGRMGTAVTEAISRQSDKFSLVAKFTRSINNEQAVNNNSAILAPKNYSDQLLDFCFAADVIIDFSAADALKNLLESAVGTNKKLVIGTTGLSASHVQLMEEAAEFIPILYAPNTSIGANLLIEMAGKISKILNDYDVEIIDIHHRYKKDAPSGTALAIGRNIAASREQKFEDVAIFNKINKEIRQKSDIGFSSLRLGNICGEHEVIFAGDNEVITISSKALTRSVFADGALIAAKWLNSVLVPGFYSMQDIFKI